MTGAAARSRRIGPVIRPALYAAAGIAILSAPALPRASELEWGGFGAVAGIAMLLLAVAEVLMSTRRRPGSSSAPPHRNDFAPLALLGRSPLDPIVCGLLVALSITTAGEQRIQVALVLAVFGIVLGYNLWRRRSPRRWLQLALSVALPALLLLLFFSAASPRPESLTVLMSFPPATALGSWLGTVAERASGRQSPKLLRAAWQGVGVVGATTGEAPVEFDVRPLLQPVSRSEAKRASAQIPPHPRAGAAAALKTVFLLMWPVILILIPTAFTDEDYITGPDAPAQIAGMVAVFSLLILGYAIIGFVGIRSWRQVTSPADHLRLARFATANGFSYRPGPDSDRRGGSLTRVLQADGWMLANVARPEQQVDSVAPVTMFSGVSEFRLPVALPHLLLVRRGLRMPAFSAFSTPVRDQRLRLEGDFNRHFDVYCPTGYERDALYLLTPDVMAALIDGAREFDVEIVDDRLILRSRRDLVTTDPAVWLTIAAAVSALAGRTRQWRRWRDDRREPAEGSAPRLLTERPDGAALAGRRLRGGASLGLALAVGYGLVYGALIWLANAL